MLYSVDKYVAFIARGFRLAWALPKSQLKRLLKKDRKRRPRKAMRRQRSQWSAQSERVSPVVSLFTAKAILLDVRRSIMRWSRATHRYASQQTTHPLIVCCVQAQIEQLSAMFCLRSLILCHCTWKKSSMSISVFLTRLGGARICRSVGSVQTKSGWQHRQLQGHIYLVYKDNYGRLNMIGCDSQWNATRWRALPSIYRWHYFCAVPYNLSSNLSW